MARMRVLIACEFSGVVREAFRYYGHDAYSCDILPTEIRGQHFQSDAIEMIYGAKWDLIICHPPCTYLANSGVRWIVDGENLIPERVEKMHLGVSMFNDMLNANVEMIAIENPIMHKYASALIPKRYDQIIHPWQFGHGETKATCLWLKGLPLLQPTDIVDGREARVHMMQPGVNRWRERSRTLAGIADAMANQWGKL